MNLVYTTLSILFVAAGAFVMVQSIIWFQRDEWRRAREMRELHDTVLRHKRGDYR